MEDQERGTVRASEAVQSAGESPRRDFMEKVALAAGGMLALGSASAAHAAGGAQPGEGGAGGRPIVELAGLKHEQTTGLSPAAKRVTQADLMALVKGEKTHALASLTFGDIRSLNDALFNSLTVIPPDVPGFRPRPSCCCCCCVM